MRELKTGSAEYRSGQPRLWAVQECTHGHH
jgi:hypothetical protein